MKIAIVGHHTEKLIAYDTGWIQSAIDGVLVGVKSDNSPLLGFTGMESSVDLYFCKTCILLGIPYIVCISTAPTLTPRNSEVREQLMKTAQEIKQTDQSWVLDNVDIGICVFDGSEGRTYEVFKQWVKNRKKFYWINPVGRVTWKCFS